jgi:gas vesicle structural protein
MAVERAAAGSSLIDVLDRVLDKGIVIDAYVRVSLVGIDLVSVEARIVVASVETYLKFAEAIGITGFAARPLVSPPTEPSEMDRILAENVELRRRLSKHENDAGRGDLG